MSERSVEIDTRIDRVSEFLAQLVLSIRQKKAGPDSFHTPARTLNYYIISHSYKHEELDRYCSSALAIYFPSKPPGKLLFCFTRLEKWSQLRQIKAQVTKCCLKAISGLSLRYAQYARLNVYFKPAIFLSCVCLFFNFVLILGLRPLEILFAPD